MQNRRGNFNVFNTQDEIYLVVFNEIKVEGLLTGYGIITSESAHTWKFIIVCAFFCYNYDAFS